MEGWTGTEVNKALTSMEVMISPGCSFLSCSCWMKCWVFLRWCGDWPTRGLMMCESSLATPYVIDPLLETMGLRGYLFYEFWEAHRTWEGLHL